MAAGHFLRYGEVKSCGCLAREMLLARITTHGMSKHPAYRTWVTIHKRCEPAAHRAADYFQRGIGVCGRWSDFEPFWEDMGSTWRSGLTLERLNNDLGYSPENCIWADYQTQANNTRRSRWIDTPKGKMTVAQAARAFAIRYATLHHRVGLGLNGDALFAPVRNGGRDGDEEERLVRQIAGLTAQLAAVRARNDQADSVRHQLAPAPVETAI